MKPYLGGRSGAISLNLRKEQSNQQPQQQRCRAGFSEHSSSCSFTRVISDVLNKLTKVCDDWTPRKKKNNQGLRQIISLFFWWRWKIFHVVMNCQKWKNNSVNEKDNSNSDRTVGSKSHRCCHRVCCPFRSSLVTNRYNWRCIENFERRIYIVFQQRGANSH